jgi:hypothetical protein
VLVADNMLSFCPFLEFFARLRIRFWNQFRVTGLERARLSSNVAQQQSQSRSLNFFHLNFVPFLYFPSFFHILEVSRSFLNFCSFTFLSSIIDLEKSVFLKAASICKDIYQWIFGQ